MASITLKFVASAGTVTAAMPAISQTRLMAEVIVTAVNGWELSPLDRLQHVCGVLPRL